MRANSVFEEIPEADPNDRTPIDVLHKTMLFYEGKARILGNHILKILRESDKAQAQTAALLYKSMVEADKLCVDAASKLAPYIHPRLESITSKISVEHKYVIEAPEAAKDPDSWLAIANQQRIALDKAKDKSKAKTKNKIESEVEDAEVIP